MYRHLTKLSLGAVASAAVIVVAFASMTGSAYATHDKDHSIEEIKGGLKALEARVWDCEQGTGGIDGPCPGTVGEQGPQGDTGPQGPQGDTGAPGESSTVVFGSCPQGSSIRVINSDGSVECEVDSDTKVANLACPQGEFVVGFDGTGGLICAAVDGTGSPGGDPGETPTGEFDFSACETLAGSQGGLTEFEARILCAHNFVRANVIPAADPPLDPLTWNGFLAAVAQNHADACVFEHNPDRTSEYNTAAEADETFIGENLFGWFPKETSAPEGPVTHWAVEAANYDLDTNTCADTEDCRHYTQIVWADTADIGCAISSCDSGFLEIGDSFDFVVCDYLPSGNVVGQFPY